MPKLEPQIEFSVGIFSHERVKHLNFTVRRSGAILRRNLPRTFHQLLLFCSVTRPPQAKEDVVDAQQHAVRDEWRKQRRARAAPLIAWLS